MSARANKVLLWLLLQCILCCAGRAAIPICFLSCKIGQLSDSKIEQDMPVFEREDDNDKRSNVLNVVFSALILLQGLDNYLT